MQNRQCNKIYLPGKISTALKVVIGLWPVSLITSYYRFLPLCLQNREVQSRKTTINYPFLPPIAALLMRDREASSIAERLCYIMHFLHQKFCHVSFKYEQCNRAENIALFTFGRQHCNCEGFGDPYQGLLSPFLIKSCVVQ